MPSPSPEASVMSIGEKPTFRSSTDKYNGWAEVHNKQVKPGASHQAACLVLVGILLSSGSCSLFRNQEPASPPLQEDFSLLAPEAFPQKIKQLEDISQYDKNLSTRTRALFLIALAHMHYKNPSPDYPKAVQYLDKYIALKSDKKDIDEMVAWKYTLQALDSSLREQGQLEKSYAQLKQQYDRSSRNTGSLDKKINDLGQVIERQKKEIENLKETIKKLDTVQQEIEKKRRGIKK